jgi:Protein of unknown function (DUF3995)
MPVIVALCVVVIIGAVAVLHLYWAFGGTAAKALSVPEVEGRRAFSPSRSGTFAVAVALLFAATIVAIAGHLIPSYLPVAPVRVLAFGLAIKFAGRVSWRLSSCRPRQARQGYGICQARYLDYAPLCLVFGVAIFYVAYSAI